jgi:hypothetical protein
LTDDGARGIAERGQCRCMRRLLAITIATAALIATGCGDDTSGVAQDAQDQAGEAVEQAGADDLATATRELAEQLAKAASDLAENPDANVDDELKSAQDRADELAEQSQNELDATEPDLATALQEANERIAEAAAQLRDVDNAEDVRKVLDQDLGTASERLADAKRLTGVDASGQLEQARDRLDQLRDDLEG